MPTEISPAAARVLADLRELASLTSTPDGAQRVAWGPQWRAARAWFAAKVAALGLTVQADTAGNHWVTLPGAGKRSVIIGSHLDSVPNGGWLDGPLGVLTGLEVLRQWQARQPPVSLHLVDWADEEGRFGRSLLGSSAATGTLRPDEARALADKTGTKLVDALAENGIDLDRMPAARHHLQSVDGRAYLELHIEQGPVLEAQGKAAGVVLGTFGVERHLFTFTGQAAHAGSTPVPLRRDAFLAAATFALACRQIALQAGAVCTVGRVRVEPDIATAVPGRAEVSLDQRALDAAVLAAMLAEAKSAAAQAARANQVAVAWRPVFRMTPRPFDPQLIELAAEAVAETAGDAPRLPSGPLHDATEMAGVMPTVMLFSSSIGGLSHCKEEDTPPAHLDAAIRAFLLLAEKTVQLAAQ